MLWELLELSYTMECEPEEYEIIQLEKLIAREKDPERKKTYVILLERV